MLHQKKSPITRETLRQPFYIHCYLLAPFALGLSIASTILLNSHGFGPLLGLAIALLSCAWYGGAQSAIYARILKISLLRAALIASAANVAATVIIAGVAFLLVGIDRG
ncbi:hypothetical protein [Dyella kyungheensis]|uniref:Uncharacterized protein n=1 Tax=Dyella kyungheensis TaxID=1242174 RepID=A0ABS2JVQ4_9GAMM|nr:hypothetical protein [Dyella kyungheensis]MBM7123093.1 hypothetical protein [Dyella kyungheensis]